MKPYEQKLVLTGLYTFALGSILGLVAVLLLGNLPPIEQTAQWAEIVSGNRYTIAYYLLVYAFLIPIVGFWAIHRLFATEKTPYILSFWGMVLSILGSALPMASMGIAAFANPAFARLFLARGLDVVALTAEIFTSSVVIFMLFSGVYYLVGIILLGIVLWRDGERLLKGASVLLILHGFLIILPEFLWVNLLSWMCLLVSSILLIIHAQGVFK